MMQRNRERIAAFFFADLFGEIARLRATVAQLEAEKLERELPRAAEMATAVELLRRGSASLIGTERHAWKLAVRRFLADPAAFREVDRTAAGGAP